MSTPDDPAARLSRPGALRDAAHWYAAQGIPVFPCKPGGKAPLTRRGFKDATTDPAQIDSWWTQTPAANIGLPTGGRFDVVDTDGPTGCRSFGIADLRDDGEPCLGWVSTPHGFHYYIAPTGGPNRTRILPGVDYRGTGGYVLAPPSRTVCDRPQSWPRPVTDLDPAASWCFNRGAHDYRWLQPLQHDRKEQPR